MRDIGIYVHIPFCKKKCDYCDFVSFSNKEEMIEKYVDCLIKEIADRSNDSIVKTIYIGGGTPSILNPHSIEEILFAIRTNFAVADEVETTIEINPGTCTKKKLEEYKKFGINRLSIGLQSSNDKILKDIGRIHTYKDFENTINLAKEAGFKNINADMIIGLPGQTIYDVEDTIDKLLKLDLTHISIYSLIVEEKTPIEKRLLNKEITLPDEEMERYMYWFAKRKLEDNGFVHYEISNFAKPGYYSKHNMDCWSQKEYLGFGIAAASYENKVRYVNKDNLESYIENIENGKGYKNVKVEERQSQRTQMSEYMILNLRKINGVDIKDFKKKFNESPLLLYEKKLVKLLDEDLVDISPEYIRLTKKGLDLANIVWEEFL